MKEVIYTILFVILAMILGLVLFFMFGPGKSLKSPEAPPNKYVDGIYRSAIQLGSTSFDVEVTIDTDQIRAIHLENLSEATAAMFPLMEPALDALAGQIYTTQSLENLQYPEDQRYTSEILIKAVASALSQAETQP